jgi:hypothetical protein
VKTSALLCLLAALASGQTWRGAIAGRILDSSEASVSGANITVASSETGRSRKAVSDASGEFAVSLLAPGSYEITVERDGFRKHVQSLTLFVNQDARVDITLQPGNRTEAVTVTATAELLKTEAPSLSTVVTNDAIRQLPLDGRNFYELSLLAPGTAPAAQGSPGSVRGDFAIHVNGAREDANNFLLDGVYNGDPKLNGVGVTPPPDAIREFEVLTHSYDASFGRNAGGQINVVLKSGTNDLHGAAWHFFRNAALDARNYFAPPSEGDPRYQRNQFGFSLGGPIARNRTFFFGDYEGTRAREGMTLITNVPTALERAGDFSQSARPAIDLFTQQPFPNNRIPSQRLHPIGSAIANLYPLPNRDVPGQNYISSPVRRDGLNHFDARIDHHFHPASEFALRYSCADRTLFEPFAGVGTSRVPGFGNDVARRAQNVMASETHSFSPRLVNELRLGFNRVAFGVFTENQNRSLNREIGLPEPWLNSRSQGLTFISLPGYSPLGDEYTNPQHSVTNTYQIIDQASYSLGRHLLKFGGELRWLQQNAYRDIQARGFMTFFGISGNPVGDLLQGFPVYTGAARVDNHQNLRSRSYALFLHDNFRVTPELTLSTGVRYEYMAPGADIRDRATVYDPAAGTLAPVGVNGMPRGGYEPDRNNFAPRIGLAWTPIESTVVRASYGMYYDQSALAPSESLYFSPPYYQFNLYAALPTFPLLLHDPFPSNYPFPLPSSALSIQRDLRTPYLQHWNAGIQQELGRSRVLEIAYVGTKGTKLLASRDINQPMPSAAPINPRPNPRFDDITTLESRANSIYHSLQTKLQQRMTRGLNLLASYTFGKSIDDASNFFASTGDPNFPQDSYNLRAERGRSSFDVRHRMSLSYVWELPFTGNRWLRGWQTSGVWTFQSGRPFTAALLPDVDNSNTGRTVLGFGANDRPHVTRSPELDDANERRWFDTGAFTMPERGTFGNAGRNIVEGPGLQTINISLLKNTSITERVTIQFRAEAFNLLNRANFDLPDNYFGSPSFGSILSAGSPRRLQFGLKFLF